MKNILRMVLFLSVVGFAGANASDVLAEVNGKKITKEDADRFIKMSQPALNFDTIKPKDRQNVIDRMVERELLAEAAAKAGTEKDPLYLKGLEEARKEILVNVWLKKQFDTTIISDGEAKEFYEKNSQKFVAPERVHARHILLKEEKEAKDIIEQLKKLKGDKLKKKFIEFAKSKSIGPSAKNGGDLGFFSKEQMLPSFSKAAFGLKKGEITAAPVKTTYGWHVIYLEEHKESGKIPFDKVKEKILQALKKERFTQKMVKDVEILKKNAEITVLYKKENVSRNKKKKD